MDFKEERIRKLTNLYYSRPDVQEALFDFSKNREVVPRYFEGFGKRPDSFQYKNDIFELVKKGATSFHCSEEIWENPLDLSTDMNSKQYNELRIGWDLLLDVDSKYMDYSKIAGELIIDLLKFHGIKNIGVKFSGNKGLHMILPWKAFPKEINGINTAEMFPEWPRILLQYINEKIKKLLIDKISGLTRPSKYIKDFKVSEEVAPDIVLVSPRHLFRMPYSLHEKTALASCVIEPEKIKTFELRDADPLKVQIKKFYPNAKEGEATELLREALDWARDNLKETSSKAIGKYADYKPVKLENIKDENFPQSIQKILKGVSDGRKRALFILINLFRSIGMEKQELEKRIEEWNKRNEVPLKKGYIQAQLSWAYRNKPILPPNFDKDYYKAIGAPPTQEELKSKNPVNYVIKKSLAEKNRDMKKTRN